MQNITTQFLGSLSANQYKTIYSTIALTLPPNQRDFTTDWVNETITSWCMNDSFEPHLSKGKKLTVPFLINFIKSRNITIRDKWGKDALNRGLGMRTKDERKLYTEEEQIIRSSHCPTEIHFEIDEETDSVVEFVVSDTTFEDKADITREIADIRAYVLENAHSKYEKEIPQVFDLYFQELGSREIAETLGIEDVRYVREIFNEIKRVARKGREQGDL